MKISKILIENGKSFRDEQIVSLNDDLNIFIGSNASGKSSLLEIINVVLRYYFFYEWEETIEGGELKMTSKRGLMGSVEDLLDKNFERQRQDQKIQITFSFSGYDAKIFQSLQNNMQRIVQVEKERYGSSQLEHLLQHKINFSDISHRNITFFINNHSEPFLDSNPTSFEGLLDFMNHYRFMEKLIRNSDLDREIEELQNIIPLVDYFPSSRVTDAASVCEGRDFSGLTKDQRNLIFSTAQKLNFDSVDLNCEKGVTLLKGERTIPLAKVSIGEREIFGMLFDVLTSRRKDGIVLFDEPELHLYPARQRIFLNLLEKLSEMNNLQFVIITHSPWMLNANSIKKAFRVYIKNGTSKVFAPDQKFISGSDSKDLVQIVNAMNNEKMFFSDKVVLVEGIGDRIIFEMVLSILQEKHGNNEMIEIVEVFGKGNLEKFQDFLSKWHVKSYVIADKDYVNDLRRMRRRPISKGRLIEKLTDDGIYILPRGTIENYFREGHFDIEESIDIAQQLKVGNRTIPDEFERIFKNIIGS